MGIGQKIALAHAVTDASGKAAHVKVPPVPREARKVLQEMPVHLEHLERQWGESASSVAIPGTGPVTAHAGAGTGARTWVVLVPWPATMVDPWAEWHRCERPAAFRLPTTLVEGVDVA